MWELLTEILQNYGPELAVAAGSAVGLGVAWQKKIRFTMHYLVVPILAEIIEAKEEGKDIVAADLIKEALERVLAHEGISTKSFVGKTIAKAAITKVVMNEALEKPHKISSAIDLMANANALGVGAVMEGDKVKIAANTSFDPVTKRIKWAANAKIKLF